MAPAGIGFAGSGLGPQHAGDLFVGAARTFLDGGYLFEFKLDPTRQHFTFSDPALADKVDDNDYKFDEGESGSLVAGKNFGIVTDIETGPDGKLYVTSLSNGTVYMISSKTPLPPPGPQNVVGVTIVANPGRTFVSAVAAFTDTDPRLTGRDFTALISWGDGTLPVLGQVVSVGNGLFAVVGAHRYARQSVYPITVLIADNQGHRVVAQSVAVVVRGVTPSTTFNLPTAAPMALRAASAKTSGLATKHV